MFISGIDPTSVRTSTQGAEFAVGTIGFNQTSAGPKGYIYVQDSGSGITGDGYVALVDGSAFTAVMATTTTSAPGTGAGKLAGVARAAIAASGYGWLQIFGAGTVLVAASAAAYTLINTTATAGQLDDDATAGAEVIDGIVLDVANGGSAAVTAAWLNWPKVARTL
jgi:hypothetical protein